MPTTSDANTDAATATSPMTAAGLKRIALQLCTCTWIEIMTGAGVTLYLLYLGSYMLAAVTVAAFAPLIIFHFAMTRIPKSNVRWEPRHKQQDWQRQYRRQRTIKLRV